MNPVQAWLQSVLQPYARPQEVFADVDRTLAAITSLSPRTETYTYDDGRTALLLTLQGTLPITFRGATYNIPVALWIPHGYPQEPPIAYVVPNASMLVRPSRNVDPSGLCTLEMLQAWSRKPEGCNLLLLIETLQAIFSRQPPLYAKPPPSQPQQQAPSSPSTSAGPPVARPSSTQFRQPPAPPSPTASSSQQPPPRPYHPNSRQSSINASGSQSPSLPAKPPIRNGFNTQHHQSRPSPTSPHPQHLQHVSSPGPPPKLQSYADGRPGSAGPGGPQYHTWQQQEQQRVHIQPPVQAAEAGPSRPPRPDSYRSLQQQQPQQPSRTFSTPVNILDAADDERGGPSGVPAPPRPVNPELLNLRRALYAQLTYHLSSLGAHYTAENAQLGALQSDLALGEGAIADEMARLEAVRDVCASVAARLRGVVDAGQKNIDDLRERPDPEVDELVCGTSVVHNQLLELVAEDNALEDTVYHLGRHFNADTRTPEELERFLKRTRALGREQYFKRTLINKILLELALARAQR